MKLTGWVVLISVMLMFLSLVGFQTVFSPVLSKLNINIIDGNIASADSESSDLFDLLFNSTTGILVSLSALSAVIVGLYVTSRDNSVLALPFIIYIGGVFAVSFWSIITLVTEGWMRNIVGLIFGGLSIGFITSCMDYFLGR